MGADLYTTPYRFLLPQVKKQYLGTQGQMANYIPYRLEPDLTPDDILAEMARQPHLAGLMSHLDPSRRIYLLESRSLEVLQLAAEYIGTFYRLSCPEDPSYTIAGTMDREKADLDILDEWRAGDRNFMRFDFQENLPYINDVELCSLYDQDTPDFGFSGRSYRSEANHSQGPWWTMWDRAPLCIEMEGHIMDNLASSIAAMENRRLILILHLASAGVNPDGQPIPGGFFEQENKDMADLAFDLETELITLDVPSADSSYRQEVLAQLADQAGAPLDRPESAVPILSLISNYRGNTDNATLSKSVSNALLRRKHDGPLTREDFDYLSVLFTSRLPAAQTGRQQKLVGQREVQRRLDRIVASMAFQKQRAAMGLPADPIHYTFAFLGAPGTGKTTWALRLAREMARQHLLDNTDMICLNAAELKAKYVGHTTGKVKALFDQYGVIILDEAYSLTDGQEGDGFGAEALAQLCVELEKHGTDRLVIFAGYGGASDPGDNRMLRFLQSNPGINSRISFKIHFQNYRVEELVEVFRTMLSESGYSLPVGYTKPVTRFFQQRMRARAFGNCREARNLADRVKLYAAGRLAGRDKLTPELATRLRLQDVEQAVGEILEEYQGLAREEGRAIGFNG